MSYTWNSYANIPYMGVLPCGITNIGGDTQVFTLDQDLFAATNPYLLLNPLAQAMVNRNAATGSPFPKVHIPSQQQIDAEAGKLAAGIVNNINSGLLKQSLNQSLANLSAQKTKLNGLLANPDLPEADKQEVTRLLDAIQEQERKLNELSKNAQNMDSSEALNQAQAIEKEIRQIVVDASKIQTPAPKTEQTQQTQPQQTPQTVSEQTPQTQAQPGQATATERQGATQNTPTAATPATATTATAAQKGKITDEHRQIADAFHDAITGSGTDDEAFNAVCEYLTKDNVVEVMAAYEQTYGTSFMNDFMWDADSGFFCAGGQKVKYGRHIARALRARAIESGVFNECKDDLQAINKEMDSTLYVSNDVYANYDNVAAIIAAKDEIKEA